MPERKNIGTSLRWSVFARDGFTCRYCGARAGQDGVDLHVDHVLSVSEGGDNSFDNLVAACRTCNGGKGARSLSNAPTGKEVIDRINGQSNNLKHQSQAMLEAIESDKILKQSAVNLKCAAYEVDSIEFAHGEQAHIVRLCKAYGSDEVLGWYQCAASHRVPPHRAIKYVYGIVRRMNEKEATNGTL